MQQQEPKQDTFFTLVVGGEEVLGYHLQVLMLGHSNENAEGAVPEVMPVPRVITPKAANDEVKAIDSIPTNIVSLFTKRS